MKELIIGQSEQLPPEQKRQRLMERLRAEGAPLETEATSELLHFLENAYSVNVERAFLLFAKDGVICKAIESTYPNNSKAFSFYSEQMLEVIPMMMSKGFAYIGTYHHHLDSDEQIALRIHPPKGQEAYKLPEGYDPAHLSPDDRGVFNTIGFSPADRDRDDVQSIIHSVRYLLLGHRSMKRGYRIKSYTLLDKLPEDHPWNKHRKELNETGFLLRHYWNYDDVLDHPLCPVTIPDDEQDGKDVEATKLLDAHGVKNRKFSYPFQHPTYGNGIMRIFTKQGDIDMIELCVGDEMSRYMFREGRLQGLARYGDNTTRMRAMHLQVVEKGLDVEQMRLEQAFHDVLKGVKRALGRSE